MSHKNDARNITPDQHLAYLADFIRYVQFVGGATPHLSMVVKAAEGLSLYDQLWRGGCYAATYNYAAAELLWSNFNPEQVRAGGPGFLEPWLKENWKFIPLRKERKAVRTPAKLADCIHSFSVWMECYQDKRWAQPAPEFSRPALLETYVMNMYEAAWKDFNEVRFMGRYIAIRFLEYCRRIGATPARMWDIRPKGGEFPRQTLALIYPAHAEQLNGDDRPYNLMIANAQAAITKDALLNHYGVQVDYYTLQSLLCEYKQCVLGQKQYPGRSIDSEMKYWRQVYGPGSPFVAAGFSSQFYAVRRAIFPEWALGEVRGWDGNREELGEVLAKYGYMWSDSLYDYKLTLRGGRWADPVRWNL